jgi:hypothetical protein
MIMKETQVVSSPDSDASAQGRLPNVGDIVLYTYRPEFSAGPVVFETTAAIVVRVNRPNDPGTSLGLAVLALALNAVKFCYAVPFSPDGPLLHCWSWPGDQPPPPHFSNVKEQNRGLSPQADRPPPGMGLMS